MKKDRCYLIFGRRQEVIGARDIVKVIFKLLRGILDERYAYLDSFQSHINILFLLKSHIIFYSFELLSSMSITKQKKNGLEMRIVYMLFFFFL